MSLTHSRKSFRTTALLLSAAAVVLCSGVASAQVPTRDTTQKAAQKAVKHRAGKAKSDVQVPVSKEVKEQGGEVAPILPPAPPVNQDSIDQANRLRDSLATAAEQARQEAIARAERERQAAIAAAERARQDSIARAQEEAQLLKERLGRYGIYWGVAAGTTLPTSDFSNAYNPGFNVTVPIGWDFRDSPLGVRIDGSYDYVDGKGLSSYLISNAQVYSLNADAKLRFRVPGMGYLNKFYLLAGGGAHRDVSTGGTTPAADGTVLNGKSNNGFATSFGNAPTKYGWNAGIGMSFGFGRSALFVESRYFSHTTDNSFMSSARFVPIILGLTF